jgi:hypothetical protein
MPHQSTARDSATPSFTLELMQDVLRIVYVEDVRRTNKPVRFAPAKHSFDDENDDELMDFPDTPECVPALPISHTTAADNLDAAQITALH